MQMPREKGFQVEDKARTKALGRDTLNVFEEKQGQCSWSGVCVEKSSG